MKENTPNPKDDDCSPAASPATQPNLPVDSKDCKCLDAPKSVPEPPEPDECDKPSCCCTCPDPPGTTPSCLEALVEAEEGDTGSTEKAKLKAELTKLIDTAKKAGQAYTRDLYEDFLKRWKDQDEGIAKLLEQLECRAWCWKCILECHICPLLYQLHYAEVRLYDAGQMYDKVNDLYDKRYWLERDLDARTRILKRITDVLGAWGSPATSIDKALKENLTMKGTLEGLIVSQPGKAIYELFFKLIPRHLAIAPPASVAVTKIDKKYTDFCECGTRKQDVCCGPDVGELSFRQRLIPPEAYLIDPNDYFKLICCLVEKRFKPASKDLISVELQLAKVNSEIERFKKMIGPDWQAEFDKNANAAIPSNIDCSKYGRDHDCDKDKPEDPKQEEPNPNDPNQQDPKQDNPDQQNPNQQEPNPNDPNQEGPNTGGPNEGDGDKDENDCENRGDGESLLD